MGVLRPQREGFRRAWRARGATGAAAIGLALAGLAAPSSCNVYDESLRARHTLSAAGHGGASADGGGIGGSGGEGDAGSGGSGGMTVPSKCTPVQPPAPADASGPSSGDIELVAVVRQFNLSGTIGDGGAPPGTNFDVDGLCSCIDLAPTCNPPWPDAGYPCDDLTAVDNALGSFFKTVSALPIDVIASQALSTGAFSLMLDVKHYDGTPNDTQVTVTVFDLAGLSPSTPSDPDAGPPAPKWDGTDVWDVESGSLASGADSKDPSLWLPRYTDGKAYVRDGVLVAHLTYVLPVGFPGIRNALRVQQGLITARIGDIGNGPEVLDGTLSGVAPAPDLLDVIGLFHITPDGPPLCLSTETAYATLKSQACPFVDQRIAALGGDDTANFCNSFSLSLGFTASRGKLGAVRKRAPDNSCPVDSCDKLP